MSDKLDMNTVLKEGKDWIAKPENQSTVKKYAGKAWAVITGWFGKKKK